MSFEFVSSAEAVAKQQQLWGALIGGGGIAILLFSQIRDKGLVLSLIGVALIGVGGFYGYRAWQLDSGGEWRIHANDTRLDWRSPIPALDPSFEIMLSEVDYIDRGSKSTASDERARYHLVMKSGDVIALRELSGVDLNALTSYLQQQGLEIRETGTFYPPAELRNR